MKLNFFPRQTKFFKLLQQQAQLLKDGGAALLALVSAWPDVESHCEALNRLERESNALYREIAKELSTSFIAELDREDIHSINRIAEELLNYLKALSSKVSLFNFDVLRKPCRELVEILNGMIGELCSMVGKLEKLQDMSAQANSVRDLKARAERLLWLASTELYEKEPASYGEILSIFKWSVVYESLEKAITSAEQAGMVLEGISLKNS